MRSVQIDPANRNVVVLGAEDLSRSTDGGTSGFKILGVGTLHVDHHAFAFDPANHNVLFDGNDGGIWKSSPDFSNGSVNPAWSSLNTNLANAEFYGGTIDTLNPGTSGGGTQDDGTLRGANPLEWSYYTGGDDDVVIIDPTNSKVIYKMGAFDNAGAISRSTEGWLNFHDITGQLPGKRFVGNSPTMDPNDHRKLLVFSSTDLKAYRTANADDPSPANVTWSSITSNVFPASGGSQPNFSANLEALAVAPSNSALIFGASCGAQVWRTTDAGTGNNWYQKGASAIPNVCLSSIVIDRSQTCNATACTVYVTSLGPDANPSAPDRVFRSTDSGATWQNVSGLGGTCSGGTCPNGFPCSNGTCPYALPANVAANKLAIHTGDHTVLYLGTDMGIYQGCLACRSTNGACDPSGSSVVCNPNGTVWMWAKFMSGFPKTTAVNDLAVNSETGRLQAFTYGRSAWETQLPSYTLPNPDLKVNTANPVTDVFGRSVRISSGSGLFWAVSWLDDRYGANNWHVFARGYGYDANGKPSPQANDFQVDDTSTHVAQAPALAGNPIQTLGMYGAHVAWQDDRLSPGVYQHVYFQYVRSDGYKQFVTDMRADQHAPAIKATNPALNFQPNLNSTIAWQAGPQCR
ncbi:MAG TPA: hypothetical protein VF515_12315 [Candidatus Binatia bacterium]